MALKSLAILLLCLVAVSVCDHLILGDVNGKQIIHHTMEQYNRIPWTVREKSFFYSDQHQRTINAIMVYDNLHSKAKATVTAGGVGFTYVNIGMKSERGEGMEYDIGIYS